MTDTFRKMDFEDARIFKVDERLGLVLGYALVCKVDGEPYFDLGNPQKGEPPEHMPEEGMLEAALDFMQKSRVAQDSHSGREVGTYPFCFPMTTDIAKSLGIQTRKTGLIVGYLPNDDDMLQKYASGEYTGFSIGGTRVESEIVEDG